MGSVWERRAIVKKRRSLLAWGGLKDYRFLQRRRAHRRHRRRDACGLRAKPQLLERFCIEFPGRIQPMRFLEFSRRFNRRGIPFPIRFSSERAIFR